MIKFSWEGFESGDFTVNCKTKRSAKNFLRMAYNRGFEWRAGNSLIEYDYFDEYKESTCYDMIFGTFGYARKQFSESKNIPVIIWNMKKRGNR